MCSKRPLTQRVLSCGLRASACAVPSAPMPFLSLRQGCRDNSTSFSQRASESHRHTGGGWDPSTGVVGGGTAEREGPGNRLTLPQESRPRARARPVNSLGEVSKGQEEKTQAVPKPEEGVLTGGMDQLSGRGPLQEPRPGGLRVLMSVGGGRGCRSPRGGEGQQGGRGALGRGSGGSYCPRPVTVALR